MFLYQEEESLGEIVLVLAVHAAALAHQARLALAPFGVEALDTACLTGTFVTRVVLLLGKEASIRTQIVTVDRLIAVVHRHIGPDQLEHGVGTVPDDETDHLPHQTRHCGPQPQTGRDPDAQFVDFNGIALGRGYSRDALLLELGFYTGGVFLRRARMV